MGTSLNGIGIAIARVMIVIGLLPNGLRKIADFDLIAAMMGGAPPVMIDGQPFPAQDPLFAFPFPELFLTGSIIFDIAGALLVIVGLKTRAVAGLMAVYCLAAITIYHADISTSADIVAILRNLPLVGGLLLLSATGPGRWSLDRRLAS